MIPPEQKGLLADEVSAVTDGCAVIVYVALTVEVFTHPLPEKANVTLYAPLVAPPDVVNGDVLVELVVVAIPGPLHVYVGVPAPPVDVAVSVIAPPEQNGFVALELSALKDACASTVTAIV